MPKGQFNVENGTTNISASSVDSNKFDVNLHGSFQQNKGTSSTPRCRRQYINMESVQKLWYRQGARHFFVIDHA